MMSMQRIGEEWVTDLMKLRDLLPLAEDAQFMRAVHHVKQVRRNSVHQLMHCTPLRHCNKLVYAIVNT